MNMQSRFSPVALVAVLLLAVPTACDSMSEISLGDDNEEVDSSLQAVVNVEDPDYGGTVPVTVTMSSRQYRDAVGKLRTQNWQEAVELLDAQIAKENDREDLAEAYFAKGVAHEAQKQYSQAAEAYENAYERDNRAEFQDGLNRARTGLED